MKRLALWALAALALAGCGSATTPRNEADWAEAREWAHEQIEPEEALLGVAGARSHEAELAKARYELLIAQETTVAP